MSVWGKSHPQSCFGPFPKIVLSVEARYLSVYLDEIPDLDGFMHIKYFLGALLPSLTGLSWSRVSGFNKTMLNYTW